MSSLKSFLFMTVELDGEKITSAKVDSLSRTKL